MCSNVEPKFFIGSLLILYNLLYDHPLDNSKTFSNIITLFPSLTTSLPTNYLFIFYKYFIHFLITISYLYDYLTPRLPTNMGMKRQN